MAPVNARELRIQEKCLNVTLDGYAGESRGGEDTSEFDDEALRKEFSVYGALEEVAVDSNNALLTFVQSSSIDAILKKCKLPANGNAPPEVWIKYRADDQGKYCVMLSVTRPSPLGPLASKLSEDVKWSIREAFEKASKSDDNSNDTLSVAECLDLVKEFLKESENKLPEGEVARIVEEAELTKGGKQVNFFSFLEVFCIIQEAADLSAVESDEGNVDHNKVEAPDESAVASTPGSTSTAVKDTPDISLGNKTHERDSSTVLEADVGVGAAHNLASESIDNATPAAGIDPVHTSLTASDFALAKKAFTEATSAGSVSSVGAIGIDAFKKAILKLVKEINESAVAAGEKKTTAPAEKDLAAAFKQIDTNRSGTLNEAEFIHLVDKVKIGEVKGMGGGMLSSMFSSRRKPVQKNETEVSYSAVPSVATKDRSRNASSDEGTSGGFLSSMFSSKRKPAMVPDVAQAENLPKNREVVGNENELNDVERKNVKGAFDLASEKSAYNKDVLMSKEAFEMYINDQYKRSSVAKPTDNEIEAAYSSMGISNGEGLSDGDFVQFAALVKGGKLTGLRYEILFPTAEPAEDDAKASFIALDDMGRIQALQDLSISKQVAYISKLESPQDRANVIIGLPTEAAAVLLVELRLHGDFADLFAVMPGKAAKEAVQAVLESGGRAKTGLLALRKGIQKNIGSQLVSCNSTQDVSKLLCSLPTAHAGSLLLEFHSRGTAGPVFDGMVSLASAGAAALLAQVPLVEKPSLIALLEVANRATILGYLTDEDKEAIVQRMRGTDKDETLVAVYPPRDEYIVTFSVTLQEETIESFGSGKQIAFAAATSTALEVGISQVIIDSVRAGSAVVSVQVRGLQSEDDANCIVSKASERASLVAHLASAGLGSCSISDFNVSKTNSSPGLAQNGRDIDADIDGEDVRVAEKSISHNDGSITGDEDDSEVLEPQAKSELVEDNRSAQVVPDEKSNLSNNNVGEVLEPHLHESHDVDYNDENALVTNFQEDTEADQLVNSANLPVDLSRGEVLLSPAQKEEMSSEEEGDGLSKNTASTRIEGKEGKEQISPGKIEEMSSEEDEVKVLPNKAALARNEVRVSELRSSQGRDDMTSPSDEVEELDQSLNKQNKAQTTSTSKVLEVSEEDDDEEQQYGTALKTKASNPTDGEIERNHTTQISAQKPFQGLEVSSEEEEEDGVQKRAEKTIASKLEEKEAVDEGVDEDASMDRDGSEANDGSIDFDESESDPRLNELSVQSQARNENASMSDMCGPSVANIPSLTAPSPLARESVQNDDDLCISPQKGPNGVSESSTQEVLPMSPAGLSVSAIQCNEAPSMDEPARSGALDMSSLAMDDETLKSPVKKTANEECEPIAESVKDFDDESQTIQEPDLVSRPAGFAPGLVVESRFGGKAKYYGAKIVQQNRDGTYEVHYDDGDIEKAVHADYICAFAKPKQFSVGLRVEARFGGKNTWYSGKVARDNGDGSYEVHYDDGDEETDVQFLRAIDIADELHDPNINGEKEESAKGSNEDLGEQINNTLGGESGFELATELIEEAELELEITFPEWTLAEFRKPAREALQTDLEKCLPLRQGQAVRVVNLRAGSVVADLHITGFGTPVELEAFVAQAVSGSFVLDPAIYGQGVVWAPKKETFENTSAVVNKVNPTAGESIVNEEEAATFFNKAIEDEEAVIAVNDSESPTESQLDAVEDSTPAQLQDENGVPVAEQDEGEGAVATKSEENDVTFAKCEKEIVPSAAMREQDEASLSVIAMDAEAQPTQTKKEEDEEEEEVVAAVKVEATNEGQVEIEYHDELPEQPMNNGHARSSTDQSEDNGAVAADDPVSPTDEHGEGGVRVMNKQEDGDDADAASSPKKEEENIDVSSQDAVVASLKTEELPSAEGSSAPTTDGEAQNQEPVVAVATTSGPEFSNESTPAAPDRDDEATEPQLERGADVEGVNKEADANLKITSTTTCTSTVVNIAPAASTIGAVAALPPAVDAPPSTSTSTPIEFAASLQPSTTEITEPPEVAAAGMSSDSPAAAVSAAAVSAAAAAATESRAVAAEQALESERAASAQAALDAKVATELAIEEAVRQATEDIEARASADLESERAQAKEEHEVMVEEVAALRREVAETTEALTKAQSHADFTSEELAKKDNALSELGAKLAREQTAKDDLQQRVTLAESELQIQLERVRAADSELDDLRRKLDGSHLLEEKLAERDAEVVDFKEQLRVQNEEVSRLSALLDEQELHPIAAQSSNEAREEDNGQEEVIQGLKEELASAAAAQERLEEEERQLQADCATLREQALRWVERANSAEAGVQRLNAQHREGGSNNGNNAMFEMFETAAVVEGAAAAAASSQSPSQNGDAVTSAANTVSSTAAVPLEEADNNAPESSTGANGASTATTLDSAPESKGPAAAAAAATDGPSPTTPAAAAPSISNAIGGQAEPTAMQSREMLEGILQQRTLQWQNEMTERLESEVRLVHAQLVTLRDHYSSTTANAESAAASAAGAGTPSSYSPEASPLPPLPLPPPSPLAVGDWHTLLSQTGRSAAANAAAWEARVAHLGSTSSRRSATHAHASAAGSAVSGASHTAAAAAAAVGGDKGNNGNSGNPFHSTGSLYASRPSLVLDGGGTSFRAHPALSTAHASGMARRLAAAAPHSSSYYISSPTKRASSLPSPPHFSSFLPYHHRPYSSAYSSTAIGAAAAAHGNNSRRACSSTAIGAAAAAHGNNSSRACSCASSRGLRSPPSSPPSAPASYNRSGTYSSGYGSTAVGTGTAYASTLDLGPNPVVLSGHYSKSPVSSSLPHQQATKAQPNWHSSR